jgi:PAS domain S-box-containing protein
MDEATRETTTGAGLPGRFSRAVMEWIALAALLLATAAYVGFGLQSSLREAEGNERRNLEEQAGIVEKLLGPRLQSTSNALASIRADAPGLLSQRDGATLLGERMQIMSSAMVGVRTFVLVNAEGVLVASNRKELVGSDWRDSERYRAIGSHPDASMLYISPPFHTPLGNWALSLGRAVVDRQGNFDGYVLAIIDPEYFNLLLESTRHRADVSTAMIHSGGRVIYRVPDPRGAVGMNLAEMPDSAFHKHLNGDKGSTSWTSVLRTTGREALIVFQTIRPTTSPSDGFLVASFGRETSSINAPWRKELRDQCALTGILLFAATLGLATSQRRRAAASRSRAEREAERRRAEEALRASEANLRVQQLRLDLAAASGKVGLWDLDLITDEAWRTPAHDRLFGYSELQPAWGAEICLRHVASEDRPIFQRAFQEALATGRLHFELRINPAGEPQRWIAADGEVLWDATGRPVRMIGAVVDITARKKSEAAHERLSLALEQAAEAVIVTDPQGIIQYVNPAFEGVSGYTRAEVIGQNPRVLKSGVQDAAFYRVLWETIGTGKVWKGRMVNRRKDGRQYTEESTISPVRSATEAITGYVAVTRDITDHLALEAQLLQAQKMEGIGRLAGGIAHDFNNVLSVILSSAGFALDGLRADDPVREDIQQIEQAGERAALLTRQLLAFSRKQVMQPVAVDLNKVLGEMEPMLRRIIGEDIDFVQVLAPDLGLVKADHGQIEQVIMNLVVNARDAMPDGGKLTLETRNVDLDAEYAKRHSGSGPGPHMMVAVTDSGVGMDETTLSRVFEPFFTTKGVGKGSGLGLSTVYGIVKQSGGSIYVYSEPGKGSTFKVYLPRDPSLLAPAARKQPSLVRTVGSEVVLLAEDDEAVRSVARRILVDAGYSVLSAENGPAALRLCEQYPGEIQLVLTDVVMPEMSGRVLVERLGTLRPGIRVLYMSGYTDNAIVHQGVLDAGTHFISKPVTPSELLRKVRCVLDGSGSDG